MKTLISSLTILIATIQLVVAQPTLNANDVSTFVLGGGQVSNNMSVRILPMAIIDAEPDPGARVEFGGDVSQLEAGIPPAGTTWGNVDESIWLNFTYRKLEGQKGRILVASNMPVPAGMEVHIEVIATGAGSNFAKDAGLKKVVLSETQDDLINGIRNGHTGDGLNNGYQLRYTVQNPSMLSLPAGFEITYTIE
jgi:hypothetical protein